MLFKNHTLLHIKTEEKANSMYHEEKGTKYNRRIQSRHQGKLLDGMMRRHRDKFQGEG